MAHSETFPDDLDGSDFNDMATTLGADAVAQVVNAAIAAGPAGVSETFPALPDALHAATEESEVDDDAKGGSLSSQLVDFVREQTELFHDQNRDTFALVKAVQETYRLTGGKFKSWLMAAFYKASGKAARDQSVREALQVLDGLALHDGEQKDVCIRVAQLDGVIFVDLAQPGTSLAAKIEPGTWSLVQEHAVRFIRPDTMRPLPTPVGPGDVGQLWRFVNVPEGSRLLVLAWLLECLRHDGAFPVLELLGEAGTAKSTTQRILRMLVDPNASNLRSPPKSVEDLYVSAGVNWVASFENVSHLSPQMQDAMCVLSTGGGYAKRKLYSDGDESVIDVMRPVVINGISACITAHDLIDRSICIEPQRLNKRIEDAEIHREFETAYPSLVAGLFYLMAQTLKWLPDTRLPEGENIRMAGFARLGVAMERAMGAPAGEFLRQFHASRQESIARTIDGSPVACALLEWFDSTGRMATELAVKSLVEQVEKFKPLGTDAWPKAARGFGDALRRAAPSLRYVGVEVKSMGKVGSTVRWSIKPCDTKPSGGYLPNQCRERRDVVADGPETGQNDPKTGGQHDITTFTTLGNEVSSRPVGLADDDMVVI